MGRSIGLWNDLPREVVAAPPFWTLKTGDEIVRNSPFQLERVQTGFAELSVFSICNLRDSNHTERMNITETVKDTMNCHLLTL